MHRADTPGSPGAAPASPPPATAFVSTYVPRRCGIATFTRDLVHGLRAAAGTATPVSVVAMEGHQAVPAYPPEVRHVLPAEDRPAYRRVSEALARDGVGVLCLQHEYGIFGGPSGHYVLDLLEHVPVPVVTTLHTILARPTPLQEEILRALADRSAYLVTITERGRALLEERYGVDGRRIVVIPHGVPDFLAIDRDAALAELGLDGSRVILSFGLLGPHKNVELVLDALARISDELPEVTYAVVGATHPEIRRRFGERYRDELQRRARELGLDGRVRFVDRYLDDRELATWLVASDVFVTPYRNAQQISSGTLAYALAAGAAVISTPYEHAVDLLGDGRGILVPFDDADALADAFRRLFADDEAREAIRRRGLELGRAMQWPVIAKRYAELFASLKSDSAIRAATERRAERPAVVGAFARPADHGPAPLPAWLGARRPASPAAEPLTAGPSRPHAAAGSPELTAAAGSPVRATARASSGDLRRRSERDLRVARSHLDELRGSLGIVQFARGSRPDPSSGACTDDVARALLVDLRHADVHLDPAVVTAIRRDIAFLEEAFDPRRGRFRNLRAPDGTWVEEVGSEDAHGRAVQALGAAAANGRDREAAAAARRLLAAALPATLELAWARPRAYAILGCAAALADPASAVAAREHLERLTDHLESSVRAARAEDPRWPWPEDPCTYDTGSIPEALVVAGTALGRPGTVRLGVEVLDWLVAAQTAPGGWLRPIGNRGWWPRGTAPARWDQQPIEPASLVAAAVAAWRATGDDRWAEVAERGFAWFLGANDLGISLADPARGACRDGLGPDGANANEGAESTLAWLMAVERIRELRAVRARRQGRSDTLRRTGVGQDRTYASTSASRAVASATVESAAP